MMLDLCSQCKKKMSNHEHMCSHMCILCLRLPTLDLLHLNKKKIHFHFIYLFSNQ